MLATLKSPEKLWKIYLCVASFTALVLCFLVPPFEVNDEFQHFFRSYQVSEGIGIGRAQGGVAGGYLPASLSALVLGIVGSLKLYMGHPVIVRPLHNTFSFFGMVLEPGNRVFADFSATVLYSPLGYIPQAVGIWIARIFGAGPLGCFYAARLSNSISAIMLTTYALRVAPFARYALFFTSLLPTVLWLDASVSQDASLIATIILFVALCLRSLERGIWARRDAFLAAIVGLIFLVSKLAYAPILFLAFIPVFFSSEKRASAGTNLSATIVVLPIIASIMWIFVGHSLMVWHEYGNYPDQQLQFILGHPVYFVTVIFYDLKNLGLLYLVSATSMFVYWPPEIALPRYCFFVIMVCFFMLPIFDDKSQRVIGSRFIMFLAFLAASSGFSVLFLLYLSYERVGYPLIEQAQGRHFIPIIPLVAVLLSSIKTSEPVEKLVNLFRNTVILFSIFDAGALIFTMYQSYKPF